MLSPDPLDQQRQLTELKTQHNDLDVAIIAMQRLGTVDQLQLQRMKKRKLQLKDEIARLEALLLPDIIA